MNQAPTGETFLGAAFAPRLAAEDADFAYLGLPLYVEYGDEPLEPGAGGAPSPAAAVRTAAASYAPSLGNYDFDLGGALVPAGSRLRVRDCGDVPLAGLATPDAVETASAAVREIIAAAAVPLVVAGDHSAPPAVVRALDDSRPLHVLHVDAHLDFRDEVGGIREGYSSPIRRLRELPWVRTVVQVGLRDVGSAREDEVVAARAAGNVLVTAEEVHLGGVDRLVDLFPRGERVYITIDVDGLDPSCAPGTLWPAPGGLWFWQVARLVRGVARRSELAGMDICELVPALDSHGHTALAAARLLMNAVGAASPRDSR